MITGTPNARIITDGYCQNKYLLTFLQYLLKTSSINVCQFLCMGKSTLYLLKLDGIAEHKMHYLEFHFFLACYYCKKINEEKMVYSFTIQSN